MTHLPKVRPLFDHTTISTNSSPKNVNCKKLLSLTNIVRCFGRHGCNQFLHGYKLCVGIIRLGYINLFEPYQGAAKNLSVQYAAYGVGPSLILEYADDLRRRWPTAQMFSGIFCFTSIPLL